MNNSLLKIKLAALLLTCSMAYAQTSAPIPLNSGKAITVVVEILLQPGTEPDEALVALSAISTMVKKRPGFMNDEVMKNINQANSPAFIHIMHWAAISYWADVFTTPEFQKLVVHSDQHYTITASAFEAVDQKNTK